MLFYTFNNIFNMSITASYVIIAVLLVRFLLKRAPKKYSYLLWSVVGFRLAIPMSFEAGFSLFSFKPFNMSEIARTGAGAIAYIDPVQTYLSSIPEHTLDVGIEQMTNAITAASGGSDKQCTSVWSFHNVFSYIWLAVMLVILLYGVTSYIILKIKMSDAVKLKDNIYQSDKVSSPFILGFISPKIYIPFNLDSNTYDYVIAHERCHIARLDYYIKAFAFVLLAVHWFNPLCYLAYFLMTRDMEMSCDERVVSKNKAANKDYSRAILFCATNGRFGKITPLCFSENSVKARIKNVLKYKKPHIVISSVAVLLCIAVVICCAANPKHSEPVYADNEIGESDYVQMLESNGIDINTRIEAAFNSFAANEPQYSSNPYDYVDKNSEEYSFLINSGEYTVRYIYSKFLRGNQTDVYGHFYRIVLEDIIGGEAIKLYAPTGQDYFDEFLAHNIRLLERNDADFLKVNYPYGYMLLVMNGTIA